jgi:nitrate reductase NapD
MTVSDIGGVLVHARVNDVSEVCLRLEMLDGVDVQTTTNDGRIVVLVESAGPKSTADCFTRIQNLDGVLSAALVYHYSDELDPVEEENPS